MNRMKAVAFQDKYENGYLYSFYRKRLLPLDPYLYNIVHAYLYLNKDEFNKIYHCDIVTKKRFEFLKSYLFLEEKKIFVDANISTDNIRHNLDNLPVLIFELTEKCNLKCKYCIYGEMYVINSKHKDVDMTFDLAKSVIDYFVNLKSKMTIHKLHQTISFYGGEPLLRFDLIKQIVEYTSSIDCILYDYTMTTNGLLLHKYYKQLVNWNFRLLISLDGNEYSSQYRKTKSGNNSFNIIYDSLLRLKKEYPKYFKYNVSFNSVMHDKNPLRELLDFMKSNFSKEPQCSSLSSVYLNNDSIEEYNKMSNNDYSKLNEECMDLPAEYVFRIKSNITAIISFMNAYSGYRFQDMKSLVYFSQEEHYIPSSTCTPFLVRLLISAEGVLFPCERIGYTYSLGRVSSDNEVEINLNEISDYYNSMYKRMASKCSICYNVYNCSTCLFQNNFSCKVVSRTDFEEKIKNVINGIIQFGHKFER